MVEPREGDDHSLVSTSDDLRAALPNRVTEHLRVVVMGVSGSGKSSVAEALSQHLDAPCLDADDYHSATNVAKMAAGQPLTDDDRWPWLTTLRAELSRRTRVVIACSALRRSYRDILRGAGDVHFVFLELDEDQAKARTQSRDGHFMKADMVASQFATLEHPTADEADVSTIDASDDFAAVTQSAIDAVAAGLSERGPR